MNLKSMSAKPMAGGGSRNCIERDVCCFMHTDEVITDSSADKGSDLKSVKSCSIKAKMQPYHKRHCKF